jgi:Short C-terminal domain
VHILGPDGQQIPVSAAEGDDISGLVHAMMSGDPAAKQAAMERIRQLKEQLGQRAAEAGHPAPGGTFDPIGQAQTFSGQAQTFSGQAQTFSGPADSFSGPVTGGASQSFGSASYSPGGSPGQYGQGSPPQAFGTPQGFDAPSSFGAPSFDSFGSGTGQGSVEERIAKLQQLHDKGILTESEYQAKRQQIINEI